MENYEYLSKKVTLIQDADEKIEITATRYTIGRVAKRLFNWRTTKKYKTFFDRAMAQGTSNYDLLIKTLKEMEY